MESMNKFKIITIIVLCMFVFAVGAIYSNTKDVTKDKAMNHSVDQVENQDIQNNEAGSQNEYQTQSNTSDSDLALQVEILNKRVDELNVRLDNSISSAASNNANSASGNLNCKIIGSLTDNGVEQLTEEAAIQEAKVNNRQIVITCSLK